MGPKADTWRAVNAITEHAIRDSTRIPLSPPPCLRSGVRRMQAKQSEDITMNSAKQLRGHVTFQSQCKTAKSRSISAAL